MNNVFFVVLFLLSVITQLDATNPFLMGYNTVTAPAGTIRGTKENVKAFSRTYEYFVYRGIRFGKDTSGGNRFNKPIAVEQFKGVYNATEYTESCPQDPLIMKSFVGRHPDPMYEARFGEDCLSVNIFTPTDGGKKKAVMVWIHGGGWIYGAGMQYFGGLLSPFSDVVYVSLNYRLGPLGYFSTGDSNAPGNYGYFDQLLALKWVKKNIEAFGGDPDKITIFGESAGSFDCMAHTISPLSGGLGLFQRAISQSAFPVSHKQSPISVRDDITLSSIMLGSKLGCNDTKNPDLSDSKALIECMRKFSLADVMKYSTAREVPFFGAGFLHFAPRVDGEFIPVHPSKLLQDLKYSPYQSFKNVDLIVAFTSNDGNVVFDAYKSVLEKAGLKMPFDVPSDIMNDVLLPAVFPKKFPGEYQAVAQEYIVDADILDSDRKRRDAIFQAMTDQGFITAGIAAAQTHINMKGTGSTWMLLLDHDCPLLPKVYGPGKANHGADTIYNIGIPAMTDSITKLNPTAGAAVASIIKPADLDISKAYMTYFPNFAKYGDPNGKAGAGIPSSWPKWPEYTLKDKSYIVFGSNAANKMVLEVKKNIRPRAAAFWLEYVPFVVGQGSNKTCPPLMDQYIGNLRITVGQANTYIIILAIGTAVFGLLSIILLIVCCSKTG